MSRPKNPLDGNGQRVTARILALLVLERRVREVQNHAADQTSWVQSGKIPNHQGRLQDHNQVQKVLIHLNRHIPGNQVARLLRLLLN